MTNGPLRIGSRGSQLALWQARFVAERLNSEGIPTQITIIKTSGDHLQTASSVQAAGKGLFTKEIEEALLANAIDVAVHSFKDLPTELPKGLVIAAVPEREDARDAIVGSPLGQIPREARVGTSSGRRAAQLRILRPDLTVEAIRGNVDTRVRKFKERHYEALVLATAGLRRLGLANEIAEILSPEDMCPAPGQGALAIETRVEGAAREICAALNHDLSAQAVCCERTALAELGGGCQLPIGIFAEPHAETLRAIGIVLSADGSRYVRAESTGACGRPEELGRSLAAELRSRGADTILNESKPIGQP